MFAGIFIDTICALCTLVNEVVHSWKENEASKVRDKLRHLKACVTRGIPKSSYEL